MGKRGPKPKGRVSTAWSPDLAYAIGLIATDGSLSNDGRHISLVSKDVEQLRNFLKALKIDNIKIGKTSSGYKEGFAHRVQFGDILFYKFLVGIGISPAKTKTIGKLKIPENYFFDFLRGSFDGDGCFYSYFDPRWKSSFMFYTQFTSASEAHILWLQEEIYRQLKIKGHITKHLKKSTINLKYAKSDTLKILSKMYYSNRILCLSRKRLKISRVFDSIGLSVKHI